MEGQEKSRRTSTSAASRCAFIDGKPFQGIDWNHEEVLLARSAKGGEKIDLVIDAASSAPWDPNESRKVHFSRAEIGTRNPELQEFWFNLEILHLLAEQLPFESARRAKIVYLLNKAVDAFDYTHTDEATLRKSALKANRIIKPLLACKADASATEVAVHGHSHIDIAWLWPYRETLRKCSRTFSSVMRMMEQYPEYIFTQSQAQLYEFVKDTYPALYEDIKKAVKAGKWEVQGAMWVEADCNLPSGESLVRQVLVGKNYFKDEFGVETDTLWLPDVFGYSAALPQILAEGARAVLLHDQDQLQPVQQVPVPHVRLEGHRRHLRARAFPADRRSTTPTPTPPSCGLR